MAHETRRSRASSCVEGGVNAARARNDAVYAAHALRVMVACCVWGEGKVVGGGYMGGYVCGSHNDTPDEHLSDVVPAAAAVIVYNVEVQVMPHEI